MILNMSSIDWGLVFLVSKQGELNTFLDSIPCEHWNDTQNKYPYWTLLHYACYSDDSAAAIRLIDNGASLMSRTYYQSPMFIVLRERHFKLFHIICEKVKVNVNTVFNYNGNTLSHSAAHGHSWDVLETLCALGANIQVKADFGETPIDILLFECHTNYARERCLHLLISNGVRLSKLSDLKRRVAIQCGLDKVETRVLNCRRACVAMLKLGPFFRIGGKFAVRELVFSIWSTRLDETWNECLASIRCDV